MGIYYNPPPPAGRTLVTPPEPHVPIGTQGSQPPRYTTAVMLVAVLASWPQSLEPRLTRPNEQQQKIAPLTLTYGQQPNPQGPITAVEYAAVVASWPPDLEPRLWRPNSLQQTIAPLTLTYGTQPVPQPSLALAELIPIVASWAQSWDAQSAPRSLAWGTPLVPVVARTAPPAHLWTAWEPPWLSPPRPVTIAPLTLVYGAQPQPQAPLSTLELAQIVGTWLQTWDSQSAPKSAAWNVPLLGVVPFTPQPALIWSAWGDPFVRPPLPVGIAPLTLVYGDPPLPQGPISPLELIQIAATWASTWDAQTAAPTAGWNVPPILIVLPYVPAPGLLWSAWEPIWLAPPRPVVVASLIPGTSPPPTTGARIILVDGRLAIRLSGIFYEWLG